jgi:hypothetical protein
MKINKDTEFETFLKIINKNGESITLTPDMKVQIKWYDSDEDITKNIDIFIVNITDEVINFKIGEIYDAIYIKDIMEISLI